MSVCFIVLAYRNPIEDLASLFASLSEGARDAELPSRCILVSNDEHFAPARLPGVEIHAGHGNIGFAAGIKIGVDAADSEYVVIANPDLTVTPRDVSRFVSHLVGQSGVVVPVLHDGGGNVAYTSYEDWVFSGGIKIAEHVCRRFLLSGEESILPRWVKICGAFVGMPTVLARAYGPFDTAFLMYGEDRDFTHRLRRDKIPIKLLREVSVTHIGGGSGAGMNRELAIVRADSAMRIAYRRYGKLGARLKSLDLLIEGARKRGAARSLALQARAITVARWRPYRTEPAPLDFAMIQQLA